MTNRYDYKYFYNFYNRYKYKYKCIYKCIFCLNIYCIGDTAQLCIYHTMPPTNTNSLFLSPISIFEIERIINETKVKYSIISII